MGEGIDFFKASYKLEKVGKMKGGATYLPFQPTGVHERRRDESPLINSAEVDKSGQRRREKVMMQHIYVLR